MGEIENYIINFPPVVPSGEHMDLHYLAAITHHSITIEGSSLSLQQTTDLLLHGNYPYRKPQEHILMALDHHQALLFCLQQARERNQPTVELIQQICALVMKNTGVIYETALGRVDSSAGEFRKGSVFAGNTYFPAFDKVPRYTKDLAEAIILAIPHSITLQQKIDLCFSSHYNLTSIHPFYDGNGRTSRLLMNFLLHYFGLPLATVFPESKEEYYQSLQQARAQERIKPFLDFMYLQYKKLLIKNTNPAFLLSEPKE